MVSSLNKPKSSDTVLRLNGWRADGQLTSQNELPQTLRSSILRFLCHDTPLNSIDWATLKFGSILQFLNLQSETCSKTLSRLETNSAFDSSVMDTTLSVGLQHASFKFPMCRSCHISYSQRIPLLLFRSQISRKSCENSKIGNKSFPVSRNETMSHHLCLLPVTANYMS
jgi:hypothetical protein